METIAIKLLLLIALLILSWTDYNRYFIPNVVVLPMILIGCYFTHFWVWAVITFLVMSLLYRHNVYNPQGILKIGGGDIKLFTMIAAFLGIWVIPIALVTFVLIKAYRVLNFLRYYPLPMAPFVLIATLFFIWI